MRRILINENEGYILISLKNNKEIISTHCLINKKSILVSNVMLNIDLMIKTFS